MRRPSGGCRRAPGDTGRWLARVQTGWVAPPWATSDVAAGARVVKADRRSPGAILDDAVSTGFTNGMPKEEPTMHGPNDHSPTALELARRAFVTTVKATSGAQRGWAKLVDQARRAAAGVPLQLTESDSRVGKDRLQLRRIAYGSARERRAWRC